MLTWKELDRQFQDLAPALRHARLDVQWGAAGEHFHVAAYFDVQAKERFVALSRVAGGKLRQCLPADSDVHNEILNELDPVLRWWRALWHLSSSFEYGHMGFQKSESGEDMGAIYSGHVLSPAESSASLALNMLANYGEQAVENASENKRPTVWARIRESVNLKPGLFGISIDLKKLFSRRWHE
jgi:hypothetical protein